MTRLLLLSTSTVFGLGYLDHGEGLIRQTLAGVSRVLFVPYALHDRDGYAAKARTRFAAMGFDLDSIHEQPDPVAAVAGAEALFIGGGNTFRLLDALQRAGLLGPIRARVAAGLPYLGASAGSNVAAPTIMTTNDMPIVQPASFEALGLVPFQINPHYLDPDPSSRHMGETREERINQFLEEHPTPVVGLREGAILRAGKGALVVEGTAGLRLFRRGEAPLELLPGADLRAYLMP